MRLSTRGRFAITAMIDLALRESDTPVPLSELALRHHISLSYLEQVFSKLRLHGLVQSTRGVGGGYTLGHRGDDISVADIVAAIDGNMDNADESTQADLDMTAALWDQLQTTLMNYMQTITLKSLAIQQRARGVEVPQAKPSKKGIFKKPSEDQRPKAPNSVFALAGWLPSRA